MSADEAALVAQLTEYAGLPFLVERPNRAATLRTVYVRECAPELGEEQTLSDSDEEETAAVSVSKRRRAATLAMRRSKRTRKSTTRENDDSESNDEEDADAKQSTARKHKKSARAGKRVSSSSSSVESAQPRNRLSVLGGVFTSAATAGQLVGSGAGGSAQLSADHLRTLFAPCGSVVQVLNVKKSPLAAYARMLEFIVVFKTVAGLEKALELANGNIPLIRPEISLQGWLDEYLSAYHTPEMLRKRSDMYMQNFDRQHEQEREARDAQVGKPDDDGFILVQRSGRKAIADAEGKTHIHAARKPVTTAEAKKRTAEKLLSDFYGFQKRESRRKQINILRRQFEEDKRRIARRQEKNRVFRP